MPEAPALPEGYRRQAFEQLPSTSARAFDLARGGAPGGLWVTADEQTAGRGRRGRAWTTGGGNLAASLLLLDPAPAAAAATISFVAGVALHQAAVDVAGPPLADRLALKWPNDLLLDGFKVAGILVEGEILPAGGFAVAVGIGVNCRSHPELATMYPASDFLACGVPMEKEALFTYLARRMAAEVGRWNRGIGFAAVRAAWLARASGVGGPIRVNLADRVIEGRFEALDEDGRLVLGRRDGGRETIAAGDVFFGTAA